MTYDADGNTLNDGTNSYTWDARNHLVSADNNGATFVYDGLGRRFGKTMLSANTNFLYDGLNPVQELNGATPTANLLTGGLDERFTRTDSTGTFDYLTDALGSTIALTNSTGASQVQYSYDPYGSMSITGTSTNSYAYTGREFDGLGIDYYRARYYNPAIDRFISEDPIGLGGGINPYAYVADSPLDYVDPLGMNRQPGKPFNGGDPGNGGGPGNGGDPEGGGGPGNPSSPDPDPAGCNGEGGNPYVTAIADGLGVTGIIVGIPGVSRLGAVTSTVNDPSPRNTAMNVASLVKGPLGDAAGSLNLAYDGGYVAGCFITDNVMAPMINSLPSNTIPDGNGHSIQSPDSIDPGQGLGGPY